MSLDLDPNHIFRDFVIDGMPASGAWRPRKIEIRQLLRDHQQAIISLLGRLPGMTVTPEMFGASSDEDATIAIQEATDWLASNGGGTLLFTKSEYIVSQQGTHTSGRGYCLNLKSRVTWQGYAGAGTTLKYTRTSVDCDVVITPDIGGIDSLQTSGICVRDMMIDGDSGSPQTGNGMNWWLRNIDSLTLENVSSVDAASWGVRIEQCNGVHIDNIRTRHGVDDNADGVHFVDCRNVTGTLEIYTQGDDGVAIETLHHGIWNYNINVVVRAPVSGGARGAGVVILHERIHSPSPRVVKNIDLRIVAQDCLGPALILSGAMLASNINADVVAENCESGLYLSIGEGAENGFLEGSRLNVISRNSRKEGAVIVKTAGSAIRFNKIDLLVFNPGNGYVGASIDGNGWTGSLDVVYNPNIDKTSFSLGVDIFGSFNRFFMSCSGAGTNVYVRQEARHNMFFLGHLRGPQTADIEVAPGNTSPPTFVGGRIEGDLINWEAMNFVGTRGAGLANLGGLPTSTTGVLPGSLWNDGGTVKIVT